jgi:very low-density lipoprotein receptor
MLLSLIFAADYETNKLFWIDAKLHLIGSSDLNGLNQQVILMSSEYIKHPFAITVFEVSCCSGCDVK